jgi:hypothetical protein
MNLNKILLSILMIFLSISLYSEDKKVDTFFLKIQDKKIERLNEHLVDLDKKLKKDIINIISEYDKKIFEIRKNSMMRKKDNSSCSDSLIKIENHLKTRKQIIDLQLEKIQKLKKLTTDCKTIEKVVIFERKFMNKLRKNMRGHHHPPRD